MKPPEKPLFYNMKTTAILLGISRSSIYKMIRQKTIESHLISGRRLFSVEYIHERFGKFDKPLDEKRPKVNSDNGHKE